MSPQRFGRTEQSPHHAVKHPRPNPSSHQRIAVSNGMSRATPTGFALSPTMSAKRRREPRPVFLSAALSRTVRQKGWRRRFRSARTIVQFLLSDSVWWLRRGIWQIPVTLRLARSRVTLSIHDNIPSPSVDIYVPPCQKAYLQARLATVSCAANTTQDTFVIPQEPVVVYVHGGAWGAGDASHYSQLGHALSNRVNATVMIVSYRLYPEARIDHQAADVAAALRYARRLFPNRPVAVLAHSSGAQIVSLALLREATSWKVGNSPLADVAILTAGPYHLMHHFLFEAGRGVADVSPMLPAACAEDDFKQFDRHSPTCLAEAFSGKLVEVDGLQPPPQVLEGDLAASNVPLPHPAAKDDSERVVSAFPRTYIMTSSCDAVVPMYSSLRYSAALRNIGLDAKFLLYDYTEHIDFVADWFVDAKPRDKNGVLDTSDEDQNRRSSCVGHLKGAPLKALFEKPDQDLGPTPYTRDVVRILRGLTLPHPPQDEIV